MNKLSSFSYFLIKVNFNSNSLKSGKNATDQSLSHTINPRNTFYALFRKIRPTKLKMTLNNILDVNWHWITFAKIGAACKKSQILGKSCEVNILSLCMTILNQIIFYISEAWKSIWVKFLCIKSLMLRRYYLAL